MRIGDLPLESGAVLRDCAVTYRSWGRLNAAHDNAILFPTFFNGTSEDLAAYVRSGSILDPADFYVLAVDALGNGSSTSPSNYAPAPGRNFPRLTIGDMVQSQRRLCERLGLREVEAIVGISMGGMQMFEWLVRDPEFARAGVSIVSTPRMSERDVALWAQAFLLVRRRDPEPEGSARTPSPPGQLTRMLGILGAVIHQAPKYRDPFNAIRQFEAVSRHDITRLSGGDLRAAAQRIRAPVLTIIATQDQAVSPETAREIARLKGWPVLELDGPQGHNIYKAEAARIGRAIGQFLAQRRIQAAR